MTGVATALLAEDEPVLAQTLKAELARAWPELQVVAVVGDGEEAVRQALERQPALCFLDIRMPGLDGFGVAQALAEEWPDEATFPLLVFVTAFDQYAVQAFEHHAVDYLLNPVEPRRLELCVARLQRELQRRRAAPPADALGLAVEQLRALLARGVARPGGTGAAADAGATEPLAVIPAAVGDTVHMVPVDDVVYFEAADKYVRVVTATREYLVRTSLRELLPQLDARQFWQVHRGTVVQARGIAAAHRLDTGKIVLSLRGRSERLAVSRLYAHLFKGM